MELRNKYHEIGYKREIEEPLEGIVLLAECKRDGTCLIINLEGIYTRHQKAEEAYVKSFERTIVCPNIKKAVVENPHLTLFLELLPKGKSPTRVEIRTTDDVVLFDIWYNTSSRWYSRIEKEIFCSRYGIPIVENYGYFVYDDFTFPFFEVGFLKRAKVNSREGVVFKNEAKGIFFKSKWEQPKLVKEPRPEDNRPVIPESEIYGAIAKVEADLGDKFGDKTIAMPKISRYIKEECDKHGFRHGGNLFKFYIAYLDRNKS